jgi:hypothetical protein
MHAIDLTDVIILYRSIYHLSEKELRVLREYLEENQQKDWIRSSKLLVDISILFVPKANEILRLYVDYRALYKVTIKNRHPLFFINETIDRLADAVVYIKLDLKDVYYRIHIKLEDEWKTAFRTRYGLFKYIIILCGLINAPVSWTECDT